MDISLDGISKLLDHFWTALDKAAYFLRPFKEDRKRYEYAINSINGVSVYYFQNVDFSCMRKKPFDDLFSAEYALSPSKYAAYVSKKLAKKEKRLIDALQKFNSVFSLKSFFRRNAPDLRTIYWDTFDEWNTEDSKREDEIKLELNQAIDELIQAYEDFRDYGHKLFAEKIDRGNVNG
ncbi:MAG: hypothetical protein JSS37_02495 [Proteobacteria bacterium]|nr:hypothetical protein [Pseudomonadota bacterium]